MPVKGYIFDIKKYSVNDGPGIRTTVFFKGCPLNCWWCHNPESQNLKPDKAESDSQRWSIYSQSCSPDMIGREISSDDLMKEIEKDIPFYQESDGGVTFSGGEPMQQVTFLFELLKLCKDKSIHTAVDTSGYTPFSNFEKIYDFTDLFLYDIKVYDEELHKMYTGVSNRVILNNLQKLGIMGNKLNIRIPLIPGVNDHDDNIWKIIEMIKETRIKKIDLIPYHSLASAKYNRLKKEERLTNISPFTAEEIEIFRTRFAKTGIPVSIGG
jgi:pyruvate formate lyase activating enzyme